LSPDKKIKLVHKKQKFCDNGISLSKKKKHDEIN